MSLDWQIAQREHNKGDNMRPRTEKGYDLFEVASAFQKSIRRGDRDEAMHWAVELHNSGFGEYMWKRLRIMVSEDVGMAEPGIPAMIHALYDFYKEQKKKKDDKHQPERLFITHAVTAMAEARKSRFMDWALKVYWGEHHDARREIPDYAYDKHNLKGRRMGRSWDHFYGDGTHLENHHPHPEEDDMKVKSYIVDKRINGGPELFPAEGGE